jgi:hypothetical protein
MVLEVKIKGWQECLWETFIHISESPEGCRATSDEGASG